MGVSIVVLYNEGCPTMPKTVELIRNCVLELKIPADVRQVLVKTLEGAETWKFLGSRTVQVNGHDIDPNARTGHIFGFM